MQSPIKEYNKKVDDWIPDPFGGLLTTEVLPKVCLKKNGTIHVPKAPAALSECGVGSGDAEDPDFQAVGTTAYVKITFKHPVQLDHKTYNMFKVKDIKGCSNSTTNSDSKIGIIFFDIQIYSIYAIPHHALRISKSISNINSSLLNSSTEHSHRFYDCWILHFHRNGWLCGSFNTYWTRPYDPSQL